MSHSPALSSLEFTALVRRELEDRLGALLAAPDAPAKIVEAVRYSTLAGGKRIRPLLLMASGEACLAEPPGPGDLIFRRLLDAACAVEMIHTFSLIHDDLPALDDDTLRRGQPTLHVRFDEATAILAGDALLNLAYEVLAAAGGDSAPLLEAVAALSRAVGLRGMISGQVLDLMAEGTRVDGEALHRMHAMKTGALITASCEIGGILAGADDDALASLREYGGHLGLAFQIVDDILDVEGTLSDLGKSPGKDADARKATFPALWGVAGSRERAGRCVAQARAALERFGPRASHLHAIADGVLTRKG